jgi:hypothetical protein
MHKKRKIKADLSFFTSIPSTLTNVSSLKPASCLNGTSSPQFRCGNDSKVAKEMNDWLDRSQLATALWDTLCFDSLLIILTSKDSLMLLGFLNTCGNIRECGWDELVGDGKGWSKPFIVVLRHQSFMFQSAQLGSKSSLLIYCQVAVHWKRKTMSCFISWHWSDKRGSPCCIYMGDPLSQWR